MKLKTVPFRRVRTELKQRGRVSISPLDLRKSLLARLLDFLKVVEEHCRCVSSTTYSSLKKTRRETGASNRKEWRLPTFDFHDCYQSIPRCYSKFYSQNLISIRKILARSCSLRASLILLGWSIPLQLRGMIVLGLLSENSLIENAITDSFTSRGTRSLQTKESI